MFIFMLQCSQSLEKTQTCPISQTIRDLASEQEKTNDLDQEILL